jgi:hypothetical protein
MGYRNHSVAWRQIMITKRFNFAVQEDGYDTSLPLEKEKID